MSEGLEALKEITYCDNIWEREDYAKIIEKELKEKEKQDKVMTIIQAKGVDTLDLRICPFSKYNQHRSLEGSFCLTKEEYDLLKEVLL